MNNQQISRILQKYDVAFLRIGNVQKGYRNSSYPILLSNGQRLNLILYKNEPQVLAKIANANQVGNFLARRGFAVRHSASPRILRLQNKHQTRYVALYNYLAGQTIPWEAYTRHHIKLLGQTMSDMHAALRSSDIVLPLVTQEYNEIFRRMQRYFRDENVIGALQQKLQLYLPPGQCAYFLRLLKSLGTLPGQQPLHMDFVRGNILFTGQGESLTISGVLDFEKTLHGLPICDIARTLAFLLVDCNLPAAKIYKYFLYSGYNKRGAAKFQNLRLQNATHSDLLEALIDLFLLHDLYKFLRHNPYESLPENYHFNRTKDLLLKRAVIVRRGGKI